jgi:fructokinase
MRQVVGIGETILDILFRNEQPVSAVPGGSVFNGVISLGKLGLPVSFITEVGDDHVGNKIVGYMRKNNVCADYVTVLADSKSPVSLAFLNDKSDAEYVFYKDYSNNHIEAKFPILQADDIVIFGSYFALNPLLRPTVKEFLDYAREQKTIIYYDPNFRSTHVAEKLKLTPALLENFEYADIVRGSKDDFNFLYGLDDVDAIYKREIQFYCPQFIYTAGSESVELRAGEVSKTYSVPHIEAVSTVGAGDNFNAGVAFAFMKLGIKRDDLEYLTEQQWDLIIQIAISFSADVCQSFANSVSEAFVEKNHI